MKKALYRLSILLILSALIAVGIYTVGITQHLMIIATMIVILKIAGGKEKVNQYSEQGQ
jgi:uncharacterized membrane protein YhaH (DUF805 family)